jgi:hypothetical protein
MSKDLYTNAAGMQNINEENAMTAANILSGDTGRGGVKLQPVQPAAYNPQAGPLPVDTGSFSMETPSKDTLYKKAIDGLDYYGITDPKVKNALNAWLAGGDTSKFPPDVLKTVDALLNGQAPAGAAAGSGAAGGAGTAAEQTLKQVQDFFTSIMQGNNPLYANLINRTMQDYGANAAAGQNALRMQLTQQGITGPAAQAILDSYARNVRVEGGAMRGDFAAKVLQDARTAATSVQNIATDTITRQNTMDLQAIDAAFTAKDFTTYASLLHDKYGISVDVGAMQTGNNANNLRNALSLLGDLHTQYGEDLSVTTPGVHQAAQQAWEAIGNTGTVDAAWERDWVDAYKRSTSPTRNLMNAWSEEDATDLFFGGVKKGMEEFQYGDYAPGYTSFKHALPEMLSKKIISWDDKTNTFDVNYDDPDWDLFFTASGQRSTVTDDPMTGKAYTVGQVTAFSGTNYTIKTVSPDGNTITAEDAEGKGIWTGTRDPATGKISLQLTTNYEKEGLKGDVGAPMTYNHKSLTVKVSGQDVPVYQSSAGIYNTMADGSGATVKFDAATGTAKLSGLNIVGGLFYDGDQALRINGRDLAEVEPGLKTVAKDSNGNYYYIGKNSDGSIQTPVFYDMITYSREKPTLSPEEQIKRLGWVISNDPTTAQAGGDLDPYIAYMGLIEKIAPAYIGNLGATPDLGGPYNIEDSEGDDITFRIGSDITDSDLMTILQSGGKDVTLSRGKIETSKLSTREWARLFWNAANNLLYRRQAYLNGVMQKVDPSLNDAQRKVIEDALRAKLNMPWLDSVMNTYNSTTWQ